MLNKKTLEPHRKKIGTELLKLREKKGVSMYAIEKETGVRFEQIKNIEEGSANYTINSLLAYTAFLGYDLAFVDIKFYCGKHHYHCEGRCDKQCKDCRLGEMLPTATT